MKKKIAIIATHPVQYNAPWIQLLANSDIVCPKVFYTWEQSQGGVKFDRGFGKKIEWDIPLLEGYDYTFVKNISKDPGSHHFTGIVNPSLINEIKQWQPDAILVIGWSFKSHLKCIRYFHGRIPVLFRGDSTILNEPGTIKKTLRRIFLKWVYHFIDYALYVGSNNKNYFTAHGLKEEQLVFAPHAIDNDRFSEPSYNDTAIEWRRKLGVKENDIVVLFAGKIEPVKNPFILLELAKRIENKKLKIIIVGNGVLEEELKKAASTDERIIFIDFQNQQQMPAVYRLGDVFMLPSKSETWGLAINEAMACGLPVIISDKVGCGNDLVKNDINGLIFNAASFNEVTSFVNRLLTEDELAATMGKQSIKIIKDFSFRHIVNSIEKLMDQF